MEKKPLFYLIIALLVILILSAVFYFASYGPWNKDLLKADQDALKLITMDQTLQLNPGERSNVLDAVISSIDRSKKPTEITATISLFRRFSNPPIPTIIRSILVKDGVTVVKGPAQSETEQPSSLSELQEGDNLSVIVSEPVSDALWREYFTALRIKKIEQE
jgi:hypothetical protein